jgi:hypothetical protein
MAKRAAGRRRTDEGTSGRVDEGTRDGAGQGTSSLVHSFTRAPAHSLVHRTSGQRAGKTGKCASCGGTDFEDGTIALYNSISYLVFSSQKRPFVTLGNSLRARVCLGCGRVELFAPAKAFKKTSGKGMSGERED